MPVRVNTGRPAGRARPTNGSSMVASGKLLFGLPQPPPGYVQRPPGISLCMIVKNEEKFLPRCLQSVAGVVDEINIVDTGSTDGTIEIARSFGARVERREWRDDFAWARNEALALATKRWILVLDADEELNADSRELVAALKTVPAHLTGVWVRCLNLADDYKGPAPVRTPSDGSSPIVRGFGIAARSTSSSRSIRTPPGSIAAIRRSRSRITAISKTSSRDATRSSAIWS